MAKENVYTKEELMKLSVPKIKELGLYSKIDSSIKKKEEIVDAMIKFQKENSDTLAADVNGDGVVDAADVAAVAEAMADNKEEEAPAEEEVSENNADESDSEEEESNDEEKAAKSEKPVFHRGRSKSRNAMTFR